MSYEGYMLYVCQNGHISHYDCYGCPNAETWKCSHCDAKLAAEHSVDETNGLPYQVSFSVEELTPAEMEECRACGHSSMKKAPRYKVKQVEWYYWDGEGNYPNIAHSVPEDWIPEW